jgi:hypothetical protein
LTIGWALDQEKFVSYLDAELTAVPGTPLAEKMNALKDTTSGYTGFMLPKAAAVFNSSQKLVADDITQIQQTIEQGRDKLIREIENSPDLKDDDSIAAAKKIVTEASDALLATIKTGKLDFGGSVILGERRLMVVAGAYISEPADLEKALTDLIEVAKKDPNFPGTKFDLVTDGDIRFHTWTSPIPPDDKVNRAIGKELKLAVGFGGKSVYVGVGTEDPLPALKKAIVDSKAGASKKVSPGLLDVSLKQILDFARVFTPDDEIVAAVQAEVAKAVGKDHVHLELKSIPYGAAYRIELQEGVLKAIGLSVKMQMDKKNRRGQ